MNDHRVPVNVAQIEAARARATRLLEERGPTIVAFRSCWNCNPAHEHFREGEWGDWVLSCFGCGRYYCDGVDITEEEPGE